MKKLPRYLERNGQGRIAWERVQGFDAWFKSRAPHLTTIEIIDEVKKKYGAILTRNGARNLRERLRAPMTPETRGRAYDERDLATAKSQNQEDPVKKMEAGLLQQQVRQLSARSTFYEMVGQKIVQASRQLAPPSPVRTPIVKKGLSEEGMVLMVSDVQAGLKVDAKESGGLGSFSPEHVIRYAQHLEESVFNIARYHPNVKDLDVFFIGDIVEGETIYGGQLREIGTNVIQQTLLCQEQFARMLLSFSSRFRQVKAAGVIGNHGRIGRKGEHGPMSNFDYLVYRMLEQQTAKAKNITWAIPETWWLIRPVQGWNFLLVHGDDAPSGSYGGIPYYSLTRHKLRYRELFRMVKFGMEQEDIPDFDYMCVGHFSIPAMMPGMILNGSWPGGTEFSIKKLQMGDVPSQKLFGVHRGHGVTWVRDIQLRPLRLGDPQ